MSSGANVASAICEELSRQGVEKAFGLPGTQNVVVFEALANSSLEFVSSTSELSAAFMAIGAFRASGKPALLTTIPGPGFTYAFTGLVEAREDSCAVVYLLVLPSNPAEKAHFLHDISHQEIALRAFKDVHLVEQASEAREVAVRAVEAARSGEPGPVLLGVSSSLLEQTFKGNNEAPEVLDRKANWSVEAETVAAMIRESKQPLFFLGMGAVAASQSLRGLIEQTRIPVFTTLSGRGIISEDDFLSVPVDFSFGTPKCFQRLLRRADLIVSIGCKFTHNGTAGYSLMLKGGSLVRINSCGEHLQANYPPAKSVHAKAEEFVPELRARLTEYQSQWTDDDLKEIRSELVAEVRSQSRLFPSILRGSCEDFFGSLRTAMPRDAVLVVDSGMHQVMARQLFRVFEPQSFLAPSDFQSMGFALPVAIGAAKARPELSVVCLLGDGCFNISAMELLSAARERINLLVLVFQDGHFGQIRMQQLARAGSTFGVELNTPRYRDLATALGAKYFKLHLPISECIRQALQVQGVKLMEIPLEDSPELSRVSFLASAKAKAREFLGPSGMARLKRLLGKSG